MKMKELEARTGVSREAIRFYIREGLLPQPKKPKPNVAEYRPEHVERTLLIKQLQDEHFLPLKIVKEIISKVEKDPTLATLNGGVLAQLLPKLIKDTEDQEPVSLATLLETTDLTPVDAETMATIGAIAVDSKGMISARDAEIVRLWVSARAMGFTDARGYDSEYLNGYVNLAAQWAELEARHFLKAFHTEPTSPASEEAAAEAGARGIELGNQLVALLHTNAIVRRIAELTSSPD